MNDNASESNRQNNTPLHKDMQIHCKITSIPTMLHILSASVMLETIVMKYAKHNLHMTYIPSNKGSMLVSSRLGDSRCRIPGLLDAVLRARNCSRELIIN